MSETALYVGFYEISPTPLEPTIYTTLRVFQAEIGKVFLLLILKKNHFTLKKTTSGLHFHQIQVSVLRMDSAQVMWRTT